MTLIKPPPDRPNSADRLLVTTRNCSTASGLSVRVVAHLAGRCCGHAIEQNLIVAKALPLAPNCASVVSTPAGRACRPDTLAAAQPAGTRCVRSEASTILRSVTTAEISLLQIQSGKVSRNFHNFRHLAQIQSKISRLTSPTSKVSFSCFAVLKPGCSTELQSLLRQEG
jgi:hypothetical protein